MTLVRDFPPRSLCSMFRSQDRNSTYLYKHIHIYNVCVCEREGGKELGWVDPSIVFFFGLFCCIGVEFLNKGREREREREPYRIGL